MPKNKKIVFVLGAGFSKDAGLPLQSEILPGIIKSKSIKRLINTIYGESTGITLEDVFTTLDKAISSQHSIRGLPVKKLMILRDKLVNDIWSYFEERKENDSSYIKDFAHKLIKLRREKGIKSDRVSIISTNWDLLLDRTLGLIMKTDRNYRSKYENKKPQRDTFVDYCISDNQWDIKLDKIIKRSVTLKARGLYNVKLIKLHGSFGWLQCPNCERIYVDHSIDALLTYKQKKYKCRECNDNHKIKYNLKPFIITPTFAKNYDSVHLRWSWWCAGIELSEATDIVFIGYSLPLADYEFRDLIARNIRKDVKIKVVLYREGKSKPSCSEEEAEQSYKDFFGSTKCPESSIITCGAAKYITESLPKNIEKIFRTESK